MLEAVDIAETGYPDEASRLLGSLLATDLRCLDAHAHLGLLELDSTFPGAVDRGRRPFEVGVAIGDLALGESFGGQLPWELIDNRPDLCCHHGLGTNAWRSGDFAGALKAFRRLLVPNPSDNQGVRLLWDPVHSSILGQSGLPIGGSRCHLQTCGVERDRPLADLRPWLTRGAVVGNSPENLVHLGEL